MKKLLSLVLIMTLFVTGAIGCTGGNIPSAQSSAPTAADSTAGTAAEPAASGQALKVAGVVERTPRA